MSLSYILNPSQPATAKTGLTDSVTAESVRILLDATTNSSPSHSMLQIPPPSLSELRETAPENPSNTPSPSPSAWEFVELIPTSNCSADLLPYSLNTSRASNSSDLAEDSSSSRSSSPSSWDFEDLMPTIPDLSSDLLAYASSHDSTSTTTNNHGTRNLFNGGSTMNRRRSEPTSEQDYICLPYPLPRRACSSALPTLTDTPKSAAADVKRRPLPQDPKMALSFLLKPVAPVHAPSQEASPPHLFAPTPIAPENSILSPPSRSPSPHLSARDLEGPTPSRFIPDFSSALLHDSPPRNVPDMPPPSRSSSSSLSTLEASTSSDVKHEIFGDVGDSAEIPALAESTHVTYSPPSPTPPSLSPPPFLTRGDRLMPPLFIPDFSFDLLSYSLTYGTAGSRHGDAENIADLVHRPVRVASPVSLITQLPRPRTYGANSRSASSLSAVAPFNSPNRPENDSPLASPMTTPPSSPPPIPPPMPNLPQIVEPPQQLPWEAPPPPGLSARTYASYQRAGVHWMLAQIFQSDLE